MAEFYAELENFRVQIPGGRILNFNDVEEISDQMTNHYGNWKKLGTVTSIPMVRIPRLFLHDNQMQAFFEKRFRTLQKGERGEIEIYENILQLADSNREGVVVFPNVESSCFKHIDRHVEIDMVVLHPTKGVFLFNVKNATSAKEKTIADDILKHAHFLSLLSKFHGDGLPTLPIHAVVCSMLKTLDEKIVTDNLDSFDGNCCVMGPADVRAFPETWSKFLDRIPTLDELGQKSVDLLAQRLFVLNVMDGSLASIHEKFTTEAFQTVNKSPEEYDLFTRELVKDVTSECDAKTQHLTEDLNRLNLEKVDTCSRVRREKKPVILWTREQLQLIAAITDFLRDENSGCRIVVEGPKGSGKTMIMTYIARVASQIFKPENVVIADGRLGASIVFMDEMKKVFDGSGITVANRSDIEEKTKGCNVLMFDECNMDIFSNPECLEKYAHEKTNLILFTSRSLKPSKSYRVLSLRNTLRATVDITRFAEEFRSLAKTHENPLIPHHNVVGMMPEVERFELEVDPRHDMFVEKTVKTIREVLLKSQGLRSILLCPMIHAVTLKKILDALEREMIKFTYRNPAELISDYKNFQEERTNSSDLPEVIVATGNHIDGTEYGSVLALFDASIPLWWEVKAHGSMFIALTRASTYLKVLYNANNAAPEIRTTFQENGESIPIRAFEIINVKSNKDLNELVETVAFQMREVRGPIALIGDLPVNFTSVKGPAAYDYWKQASWFSGPLSKLLVTSMEDPIISLTTMVRLSIFPCAIVITSTKQQFESMLQSLNRHAMLYMMVEKGFTKVPFYWVLEKNLSEVLSSKNEMCLDTMRQFFHSRATIDGCESEKVASHTVTEKEMVGQERTESGIVDSNAAVQKQTIQIQAEEDFQLSWQALKETGNSLFKSNHFDDALSKYKQSLRLLRREYEATFQESSVNAICATKREIAKLFTNMSLTTLKIFEMTSQQAVLDSSLQYAEKAIDMDPTWDKGYHRAKEAMELLHMDPQVVLKNYLNISNKDLKRLVIEEKLRNSKSWELARFKESAFLIDLNGEGDFRSLQEALENVRSKHFSLFFMPGEYHFYSVVHLEDFYDSSIDIIGDWEPSLDSNNGWISQDSPIVFQNSRNLSGNGMLLTWNFNLRLARITILDPKYEPGSSVIRIGLNSIFEMIECSCHSKVKGFPAISLDAGSKSLVKQCRFYGGFHPILSDARPFEPTPDEKCKTHVEVHKCVFNETIGNALELRFGVTAKVKECHFVNTGHPGLGCTQSGNVSVENCLFDNCAYNKSINEGALQLRGSNVHVKDTSIKNQKGHGLVIEYGHGKFENLDIRHCISGGILTQAPLEMRGCLISHTKIGLTVCENIQGQILMEGNVIANCQWQIVGQGSLIPVMKGRQHVYKKFNKADLDRAAREQMKEQMQQKKKSSHGSTAQHEWDRSAKICTHCSTPESAHSTSTGYITCPDCDFEVYCSKKCLEDGKSFHESHCKRYQEISQLQSDETTLDQMGDLGSARVPDEQRTTSRTSKNAGNAKSGNKKRRNRKK